jgi:hypothetical protein
MSPHKILFLILLFSLISTAGVLSDSILKAIKANILIKIADPDSLHFEDINTERTNGIERAVTAVLLLVSQIYGIVLVCRMQKEPNPNKPVQPTSLRSAADR